MNILLLVVEILADALGHRDGGALQLQHAERDAVDVEHDVRALRVGPGVGAGDGHLLGDGEVVLLRVLPVDQPDGLRVLADVGLHLHAVAQQVVDGPVAVVEALARVARFSLEQVQRPVDQVLVVALLLEKGAQQVRLDVAVAVALVPVAEVVVAQRVAERGSRHGPGSFALVGRCRCSYESCSPGQQFLHHALLEGAGLVAPLLQRGDLRVHVGEDGGDGGLFGERAGTE